MDRRIRELSGVCTHPDVRGRGHRALSAYVVNRMQERGETPFLHVLSDNEEAIELYRTRIVHRAEFFLLHAKRVA